MNHQAHCSSEDHIPNCICFHPIWSRLRKHSHKMEEDVRASHPVLSSDQYRLPIVQDSTYLLLSMPGIYLCAEYRKKDR